VREWDVNGHQIGAPYDEGGPLLQVVHTLDGTRFVSCGETVTTVRESESGKVVVKLDMPKETDLVRRCCFSPDGRFVAYAFDKTIHIWDISKKEPRFAGELVGHADSITFLIYSSSLISGSHDKSVKFWQSGSLLMDSVTTNDTPTPPGSAPIQSVEVFTEDGVVVTSDSSGVVKTWDLTTGECKSSFSTPAQGIRDTRLAGDTLIIVWIEWENPGGVGVCHIWNVVEGRLLRKTPSAFNMILHLKISEDGSKLFTLGLRSIQALSIQTGEDLGVVGDDEDGGGFLVVRGSSKVWAPGPNAIGWDFGGKEPSTFSPPTEFPDLLHLGFEDLMQGRPKKPWVLDITGKSIFCIPERYLKPGTERSWDSRYLVVCFPSGEVVIMDFGGLRVSR
jgi:WD40 repeat protein